jgi:hypothetical protein
MGRKEGRKEARKEGEEGRKGRQAGRKAGSTERRKKGRKVGKEGGPTPSEAIVILVLNPGSLQSCHTMHTVPYACGSFGFVQTGPEKSVSSARCCSSILASCADVSLLLCSFALFFDICVQLAHS